MSKKYTRGKRLVKLCQNNQNTKEKNNVDISLKPSQSSLVEKSIVPYQSQPVQSTAKFSLPDLICHEKMNLSDSDTGDYDSDDSVKDKDYIPSLNSERNSSDTENDERQTCSTQNNNLSKPTTQNPFYCSTPILSETSSADFIEDSYADIENDEEPERSISREKQLEKSMEIEEKGDSYIDVENNEEPKRSINQEKQLENSIEIEEKGDSYVDVENNEEPEPSINHEKLLEKSMEIEEKEKNDSSEQEYADQQILKKDGYLQKQNNTEVDERQTTVTPKIHLFKQSQIISETNYFNDYQTENMTATKKYYRDRVESLKSLCLKAVNNIKESSENINKNYAVDGSEEVVVFIIIEETNVKKDEGLPPGAPEEENIQIDMEIETSENNNSEQPQVADEEPPLGTPEEVDIPIDMDIEETRDNDNAENVNIGPQLTKDGKIRKRKKYATSLCERKKAKENEVKAKNCVKTACSDKCILKCRDFVTEEEREIINKKFWSLTWKERRLFIKKNTIVAMPKRKITSEPKRSPRRHFCLINSSKVKFRVCKVFFLTTLGFKSNNDKVLYNALVEDDFHDDLRGRHQKTPSINKDSINAHIESFNPSISHYRREHAPNKLYLPSDISVKFMYDDYKKKHPSVELSYEIYRKQVKFLNISFTCLGHEECASCEEHKIHSKSHGHGNDYNPEDASNICQLCKDYKKHKIRSAKARKLYKNHTKINEEDHIYFSTDLEKVIMLPRLDTFKEVVFCPRLVAYNQTFAPVGEKNKRNTFAVLWHEAVSGRKQEDIMSAFKMFLTEYRDVAFIHIWLDNCGAQNKNWLLYFFLIHFINSDETGTKEITLYYFEKGHTFMSCDSFHHQVELSMKRRGKLYDFKDFVEAVSAANSAKVVVKDMTITDFIKVEDFTSSRRITNSTPRVYMKDIVQVTFKRGNQNLFYKLDFDANMNELCFLKDTYLKPKNGPITVITTKTIPRGIKESRKRNILNKLGNLMPPHKKYFWENISTNDDE